jgi:hypothetical protein
VQVKQDFSSIVFPGPANVPHVVDKFTGLSESPTTTPMIDHMPSAINDTKVARNVFDRREKFTRY